MKDDILRVLKENRAGYVSGEALSTSLHVTRTAVWKYMKELKGEGYIIESFPKKGYRFISGPDILNTHEIGYNLNTKTIGNTVYYFDTIDSTSNYAKKLAFDGCVEGTLVVADIQTAGRGRLGRSWESPGGRGIWMSVVLRPSVAPEDVQVITLAASVAVVKAIRCCTGIQCGIKWPNDIILDGRKVCGILTEMNSEVDRVNFIVLGLGINVHHSEDEFPEAIKDTAISLKVYEKNHPKKEDSLHHNAVYYRSTLLKAVLAELEAVYFKLQNGDFKDIIEEWKSYSVTLGKGVAVTIKGNLYKGTAENITDEGKLTVRCSDGVLREVSSGEVQLRGILGYAE